jgi:hypothetical protein
VVTGTHSSGRTVTTGRRRASLIGRWRIEETDVWGRDDLDLVGPAFIEFGRDNTGSFGFVAVRGWMDCRQTVIDECPAVDFGAHVTHSRMHSAQTLATSMTPLNGFEMSADAALPADTLSVRLRREEHQARNQARSDGRQR